MRCFRLDDFDNACSAYEKAIELDKDDHLFHLNFAITLFNNDEVCVRFGRSNKCSWSEPTIIMYNSKGCFKSWILRPRNQTKMYSTNAVY